MRIAYLSDAVLPSTSAHAIATFQMVAAMGELGHAATLFAPWHGARAKDLDRLREEFALRGAFALRYLPYLSVGSRLSSSYLLVAAAAARATRALVYTRNVRLALHAARLGSPVILETHQTFASPRWRRAAQALAVHPRLLRWVFISEHLRTLVAREVSLPPDRCLIAHSGVDLERFTPALDRTTARRQLGLDPDRVLVVHAGHMYEGRGIEVLLHAVEGVPEVDLLLVGGTPADVARVRALAGPRVRVLGHRPPAALPPLLFAADILVMPYTSGTTTSDGRTQTIAWASPMKLFEYLAAGRAIVSTRFPALAEVLVDGHNARLVEPDRVEPLRDALAQLAADPDARARLGVQARADAEPYRWRARAQRVLDGL